MSKTSLVTGITGQDGAYLAKLLLDKGHRVIGLVRPDRQGAYTGLDYVGITREVQLLPCDLCSFAELAKLIEQEQPDEIYNLAALSSVSRSFAQPGETLSFNLQSVLNLLRVVQERAPGLRLYQASSSDMFGQVPCLPIRNDMDFHPLSPYAVSKASAHWMAKNYRESFGLFVACGILFNHESPLRSRNFFVKKVIAEALEVKAGQRREIRVGNLAAKRDFGYAPKYVEAMYLMLQQEQPGDYLVCSGRSVALDEIVRYICLRVGIDAGCVVVDPALYRPLDIPEIYGDNRQTKAQLGWEYDLDFLQVLDLLIAEEQRLLEGSGSTASSPS